MLKISATHPRVQRAQQFLRHNFLYVGITILAVGAVATYLVRHQQAMPPSRTATENTTANLLADQWAYLPGTSKQGPSSLRIEPVHFAIVNQDGSGGQANPAVNLYGTHVQATGDFTVTARLNAVKTKATLQLYGSVPLVADEFRIEGKSVQLAIDGKSLTVATRDSSDQTPSAQTFAYTPASDQTVDLVMARRHDTLAFSVNGKPVGSMPEKHIFSAGAIWFGADAPDSSWTLANLQVEPLGASTVTTVNTASGAKLAANNQGLQALASKKRPGFLVGAAMALAPAVADDDYRRIAFGGNFGSLTTENALKWQFVHPQPDTYTFQEGDALVALARQQGLAVHGHALVFGEANPRWVQALPVTTALDKQHVEQVMTDHIKTVAGHYKGTVASWDVVNEPLADYDDFDTDEGHILRTHKWEQAMGESYIAKAFVAAHTADPGAQLFMNEYGLEEDGERWDTFLALLSRLQAQHVPINGVGIQSHVYEAGDKVDPTVLKQHIEKLAAMGLKTRISEMDVYSEDGQAVQAEQYADVFQACLSQPSCVSWTSWGVSDRYDYFKDDDGSIQQGQDFLWDKNMQPTPAVAKLQALLQ